MLGRAWKKSQFAYQEPSPEEAARYPRDVYPPVGVSRSISDSTIIKSPSGVAIGGRVYLPYLVCFSAAPHYCLFTYMIIVQGVQGRYTLG
jgi:hypothetical protein